MKYYLLGVDAGFRNTGLALFEINRGKTQFVDGTVITTKKKAGKKKNVRVADDDVETIKKITSDLQTFIKKFVRSNDVMLVGIEYPHGGAKGARPIRTMAMITGCLATYFELTRYPVQHVTPSEVKEAITKKTSATKEEIILRVMRIIGERHKIKIRDTKLEHFCDAVGAALWVKKYSDIYKIFIGRS